jgi:hypothetical protein
MLSEITDSTNEASGFAVFGIMYSLGSIGKLLYLGQTICESQFLMANNSRTSAWRILKLPSDPISINIRKVRLFA